MVRKLATPAAILLLAGAIVALDYLVLEFIWFPVLFVIPVMLAAWRCNVGFALSLAVGLPAARLWLIWTERVDLPWDFSVSVINASLRVLTLALIALLTRSAIQGAALSRRVKVLEGLLPICSFCKKIRDENDEWQKLERYITSRSDAHFTHSVCPQCMKEQYSEYFP